MVQHIEPKHLLTTHDNPTQSIVHAVEEENYLPKSHPLASLWISSVQTTNMKTIICYAKPTHGSRSSYRNQIGALGSRAIITQEFLSECLQDLSLGRNGQTHLNCSITRTFFPRPPSCPNSYSSYYGEQSSSSVLTGASTQGSHEMPVISKTPYQWHWSWSLCRFTIPGPSSPPATTIAAAGEHTPFGRTVKFHKCHPFSRPLHMLEVSHSG